MKVSKEQARANRRHIVETAAALFRDRGFEGISVADLMHAAGFTHGGFYRHFASKDELVTEATQLAYAQLERDMVGKSVEALMARYLSRDHRDELATACPTSTLGGEAMRQADPVRAVFAHGVDTWIGLIEEAIESEGHVLPADRRRAAIDLAVRAVGGIVLARAAAGDPTLSDEILDRTLSSIRTTAREKIGTPRRGRLRACPKDDCPQRSR
jgi:TetR/AcrR family transcriptional repressor of nem operon